MPSDRRTCATRPRYAPVWTDASGRLRKSDDGPTTLCRGAATSGRFDAVQLQHRRLSESFEIHRTAADLSNDPRTGKCRVPPPWANSSQYLHQCAADAAADTGGATGLAHFFR